MKSLVDLELDSQTLMIFCHCSINWGQDRRVSTQSPNGPRGGEHTRNQVPPLKFKRHPSNDYWYVKPGLSKRTCDDWRVVLRTSLCLGGLLLQRWSHTALKCFSIWQRIILLQNKNIHVWVDSRLFEGYFVLISPKQTHYPSFNNLYLTRKDTLRLKILLLGAILAKTGSRGSSTICKSETRSHAHKHLINIQKYYTRCKIPNMNNTKDNQNNYKSHSVQHLRPNVFASNLN